MLKTVKLSQANKTAGCAVTYRAGKANKYDTCPVNCELNASGRGCAPSDIDDEYLDAVRASVALIAAGKKPRFAPAWIVTFLLCLRLMGRAKRKRATPTTRAVAMPTAAGLLSIGTRQARATTTGKPTPNGCGPLSKHYRPVLFYVTTLRATSAKNKPVPHCPDKAPHCVGAFLLCDCMR
jgi:hypothetical protein